MAALLQTATADPNFPQPALVIAPKPDTPALKVAQETKIPTLDLDPKSPAYPQELLSSLQNAKITLVALAGYMTLLPPEILTAYPRQVLNIHPALLPEFGGKGMYGHHVHEAVVAARPPRSGCTVHFVSEQYDEGAPILQLSCRVFPEDTAETLAARVLALEHAAYPEAIRTLLKFPTPDPLFRQTLLEKLPAEADPQIHRFPL